MSVKHIYLIRHGETNQNSSHHHQILSTPLNAHGLEQAHATAMVLEKISVDLFISSDAVRTVETAQALRDVISAPLVQDKTFREVQRPKYIMGAYFWSIRSIIYTIFLYVFSGANMWPYKDGENMKAVQGRASRALALLSNTKGDNIVVVSHRLFISAIFAEILGKDITKAFSHFWTVRSLSTIANGSITEILFDSDSQIHWKILRKNDILQR